MSEEKYLRVLISGGIYPDKEEALAVARAKRAQGQHVTIKEIDGVFEVTWRRVVEGYA